MKLSPTSLEGLVVLEPVVYGDDRGSFSEIFNVSPFEDAGLPVRFTQDNISRSHRGVIRGLHFQIKPFEQGKLVVCISGAIFDVAVDLRPSSPTFGKWASVELSEDNHLALYVPEGFAHGFQSLRDDTCVLYKCTTVYSKEHEGGILFNDAELDISWPLPAAALSPKDAILPTFEEWKNKANLSEGE
jgi:dTDP-4-dehydrorhamnose 3,5-epimerase